METSELSHALGRCPLSWGRGLGWAARDSTLPTIPNHSRPPASMWAPDDLESVACDLCRRLDSRPLCTRSDGLAVCQCRTCGLAFLSPRPKLNLIRRLYGTDYFQKEAATTPVGYCDYTSSNSRGTLRRAAEAKLDFLQAYWTPAGQHCLEIGCATGEFAAALHGRGAKVIGLDISPFAIKTARERYPDITWLASDLTALAHKDAFEAIFAFEVIEHVPSPTDFLRAACRQLRAGGVLVLTTPNLDCARRVGLDRWMGFQVSFEHLYYFNPGSLQLTCAHAGLKSLKLFSGGGHGLLPTQENQPIRHGLRRLLGGLGLLRCIRAVGRRAWRLRMPLYTHGLRQHSLLGLFTKPKAVAESA